MLCHTVDCSWSSQLESVYSLQPNVASASDVSARSLTTSRQMTGSSTVKSTGEKKDSGSNVIIRHDRVPLKALCTRCSFTCNNASQLALHMKTGHEVPPYTAFSLGNFKCTRCSMNTPKKDVMIWHLSHHLGKHIMTFYRCDDCNAEKQYYRDIKKHVAKRHKRSIRELQSQSCRLSLTRVESVSYLENIMKCPVCKDGLLWKHIFVKHLQDMHNLVDLARYIEANYDDKCPDVLSIPVHLLKSRVTQSDTEVTDSSEMSTVSCYHCDDCEFSTNDLVAYWQHQASHSRTSFDSDSLQKESDASIVDADHTLYHRAAKVKAFAQIITPKSPKPKNHQSPKRKGNLHRKSAELHRKPLMRKRTTFKSQAYSKRSDAANAAVATVASKNVDAQPQPSSAACSLTEFIKKLPSPFVFSEEIKCPACHFATRVRMNLQRHIQKHIRFDASASSSAVSLESGTGEPSARLSYSLWKPYSSLSSTEVESLGVGTPEARTSTESGEVESPGVGTSEARTSTESGEVESPGVGMSEARTSTESGEVESPGVGTPEARSSTESGEVESPGVGMSEARTDDAVDTFPVSLNSRDDESLGRQTAEEVDPSSQTEYTDSCAAVSDAVDFSASETEDEAAVEPDSLCCETCSQEFSSDVDLERHISESHGGAFRCHLCGVCLCKKNAMCDHYSTMHPGSALQFEVLHKKADSGSKEVGGSGTSERKIAVVQGNYLILLVCSEY